MSVERFALDTNVLVYAFDEDAGAKQERGRRIVSEAAGLERCALSVQSLGEFYVAARRRTRLPSTELIPAARDFSSVFTIIDVTIADAQSALDAVTLGRLSYWDALLIATVARAGCTTLLSEDMQDGFTFGGITISNPFGGDDLPPRVAELLRA